MQHVSILRDVKPPLQTGSPDDFQTPPEAVLPLLPYLRPHWRIWEPASGKGNVVAALKRRGFQVIPSDVKRGRDFLRWQPRTFDCIATNPPYSLKNEFFERAYALGKPFAFLVPITSLESARRQRLFSRYGIELILFDRRINFETPDGRGSGSWFATAWFTHGLRIGRQLQFVSLADTSHHVA